jgi:Cu+-exporting ATPase
MKNRLIEWKVEGMDCSNCAESITRFLTRKGLEDVFVNFSTKEVRFSITSSSPALEQIEAGIQKLGYTVCSPARKASFWTLETKLLIGIFCTVPLLTHHILMVAGMPIPALGHAWVQLLLCLPIFGIGFLHFGKSALGSLRGGVPNMDVLIWIGSTAAFVYSVIGLVLDNENYIFFETAATIITLVLAGNWLEKRAVAQTTSAIGELTRLQVETARRIMPSGVLVTVRKEEIGKGDLLQINEGDKIPADGVLREGRAWVDESMLTGESSAIEKQPGDWLIGASLVKGGNFSMEVRATGRDTVLSQMIELVKTAQKDKPEIQRLADRISAVFVPTVVGIAVLTFIIGKFVFGIGATQALMNAIAVLVISCPCAMGLATPTAVMVGVGRLARQGILIKGGQTLEVFSKIKQMVFDKTGTLTNADFKIREIVYFTENKARVHTLIHHLEQHSSHPIAKALVAEMAVSAEATIVEFKSVAEERGKGVYAEDATGNKFQLGSSKWLTAADAPEEASVCLAENGILLAAIYLEDQIKPEALPLIEFLRANGVEPIILSGDTQEKTSETANKLGVAQWFGGQSPAAKLERIAMLSARNPTAMVGDGINDAAALSRATVGISLSDASQAAIQSAQIVLLHGNLGRLREALQITRKTVLTIRQNLFWAFAYNIVAIPLAASGMLNPMWGALFMAFSDIVVIGNSIRLKYKKID